ncbi:MAG: FHA domain-containing protein [Desulforhopalus sp.]
MPIITLKFKEKKIRDYPIAVGQSFTIGRKAVNDIVIDNLAVSGSHAKIESVATTFVIRDLDSTNGTFVNEEKISLHNLRHMDIISVGKHELVFDRSDLMKKSAELEENFDDDKTRILDTSDFRKLTGKDGNQNPQPELSEIPAAPKKRESLWIRLLNWIFG